MDENIFKTIYLALVRSYMEYVVQAWSAQIRKDINLLEISPQHLINDEYNYSLDYSEQNIVESYFDLKFENFTGKNPYQSCQYDKSFSDNSGLTGHLQTHTEEKPYQCTHYGIQVFLRTTVVL